MNHYSIISIFLLDIEVQHNGKTYTLVPSRSGDFEGVKEECEWRDLKVFEPRDKESFYAVYNKAYEAGMTLIFMNMRRSWLASEKKWGP